MRGQRAGMGGQGGGYGEQVSSRVCVCVSHLRREWIRYYLSSIPDLNYKLRCSDLCVDFKEDLEFRFSFGITSLMVHE